MKIQKKSSAESKPRKSLYSDDSGSEETPKGGQSNGTSSWMMTNPREMREASEAAKSLSGKFPPEVYFISGEPKVIRLRTAEPIASFRRYRFKRDGKWRSFTAPPAGEEDLFAEEGMKASLVFVWEVIDETGFTPKKGPNAGKLVQNQARFLIASGRLYDQFMAVAEDNGPLNRYSIKVRRSGQGTSTTYTLLPQQPKPLTDEQRAVERIGDKVAEYYAPLDARAQAAVLRSRSSRDEE